MRGTAWLTGAESEEQKANKKRTTLVCSKGGKGSSEDSRAEE